MNFLALIPARYASTRFPGKPLALLAGKPIIQHVYERVSTVFENAYVVTDDERIEACVNTFGGRCVMTGTHHKSGTDRCFEALEKLGAGFDVVVNVQGDEPFIQPDQIQALMDCFPTEIATLVHPFTEKDSWSDLANPNYVKVAIARENSDPNATTIGRALYFSRSVIPYLRGIEQEEWLKQGQHFRHIGMYAYRADILQKITQIPPAPLEKVESLEQLRWLQAGYRIKVGTTDVETIGIDTPEDLERAKNFLEQQV